MYVSKKKSTISKFTSFQNTQKQFIKSQSTLKLKLALSSWVLHSIKETSREKFVETPTASCIFTPDCIFKGFNKILNKCTSPQKKGTECLSISEGQGHSLEGSNPRSRQGLIIFVRTKAPDSIGHWDCKLNQELFMVEG